MKMKDGPESVNGAKTTGAPAVDTDLRVVVFSDAYRHRNGVGAYYDDLLGHLAPRLTAAALVCPGFTASGRRQGISIPLPGDRTQRLCLPGIPKAVRVMRRIRPHVVIVASPGPYGLLGVLLAKLFHTALCIGYHTQYDKLVDLYWNRVFGGFASRYLYALDRMLFRRACYVLTNSFATYEAAQQMGAPRVRLMGTPIETQLLNEPVERVQQSFGPVLFVGRLAHEKNIDVFLEAARHMPGVPFIIAGDGAESVSAVLIDEFHERGWEVDLLGAALLDARERGDFDAPLVFTSATVDAAGIADIISAEVVEASGRTYPVDIEYRDEPAGPTSDGLAGRVRELEERYAEPLPAIEREVENLAARVTSHLEKMGVRVDG